MSIDKNQCDLNRIDAFLNENIDFDQNLMAHLEVCEGCRLYMASQVASTHEWQSITHFLQPTEFDIAGLPDFSIGQLTDLTTASYPKTNAVLKMLAPTDNPHMLGRIGPYEVSGIVGSGGMGVVLKAFDATLDRTVAIKILSPHLASSAVARRRFARESKAAAAVIHPNVIAIHSVAHHESLPYLVMSFVRGGSLEKRLQSQGPFETIEILRIGLQICAGLAAAHAQGLVHRDIKPANILLEEGVERVALTDFGLARAVDDASITHTGAIAGTPQYMSPEQARGETVDPSSDLFSLGSVLYAMCTGRRPFSEGTTYGVIRSICEDTPTSIRSLNPDIPVWLERLIQLLMEKNPKDRLESAEQVGSILEACLAHVQQPTLTPLPSEVAKPSLRKSFKQNLLSRSGVMSVLVATIAIAGLIFWFTSHSHRGLFNTKSVDPEKPASPSAESEHKTAIVNSNGVPLALGKPTPQLSGLNWLHGLPINHFESGKIYVVNFLSLHDPRFVYSLQTLAELKRNHVDVSVIHCIATPESDPKLRALLDALSLPQSVATCSSEIVTQWQHGFTTHPPSTFIVDGKGRLVWRGIVERASAIIEKFNSARFNLETESRAIEREEKLVVDFQTAVVEGEWDRAIILHKKIIHLAPVIAGDFEFLRFKLRISDASDVEAAIRIAKNILMTYPGQSELFRKTSVRVTRRIYEEIFISGEVRNAWLEVTRSLATESVRLTLRRDAPSLAALAQTYDVSGELNIAIELQQEALECSNDSNREQMKRLLDGYLEKTAKLPSEP